MHACVKNETRKTLNTLLGCIAGWEKKRQGRGFRAYSLWGLSLKKKQWKNEEN
jgi:hypothetical protein